MSVTDNRRKALKRHEGDARSRLQQAALALFDEQGYEQTTAAQIAARAGVTERTFFRYFPDKREVLFGGEHILRAALLESMASAPAGLGPIDTLFRAFHAVEPMLNANRAFSKPRQAIISAMPALREREAAKHAALTDALAAGLVARGTGELRAAIAAQAAMAAFVYSTLAWLDAPQPGLGERIDLAYRELQTLME